MARFARDPHWIITKYEGRDQFGRTVPAGCRAFYYPATRKLLTGAEAEQASRDFESAAFDESAGR